MQINCPYCGASYDINDSLVPDGKIKVKCRVCTNIFILNKNTGAVKAESLPEVEPAEPEADNKPPADYAADNDFMQSVTEEIKTAIAEEIQKRGNNAGAGPKKNSAPPNKGKSAPFRPVFLIILILLLLIVAAAAALVHYKIIDIPFLPSNLLSF